METKGTIYNIQRYSLHDGPGIRTNVFLKGCPMRCRWCCNPESQKFQPETIYLPSSCIGEKACGFCHSACPENAVHFSEDKALIERQLCKNCLSCASVCPSKAIKVSGETKTVSEVLDIVEQDAVFFRGKGGLTISGGEPLAQGEFLIALLKEAKTRRLNTAIETCGYGDYQVLAKAAKHLDTIMFDIKSLDKGKHKAYTGCSNTIILDNFIRLCQDFPTLPKIIRTPVIPGFNDEITDVKMITDFLENKENIKYELLPYHRYGEGKYAALGRNYPLGDLTLNKNKMQSLINYTKTLL